MSDGTQQIVVAAAVAGSIAYLILRARKKTGCGGGCGTSCAVKKPGENAADTGKEKSPPEG